MLLRLREHARLDHAATRSEALVNAVLFRVAQTCVKTFMTFDVFRGCNQNVVSPIPSLLPADMNMLKMFHA